MTIAWTKHRFSGGLLALDVANTVVLRNDPALTFDRFADVGEITRFAQAANVYRAEELGGRSLAVPKAEAIAESVIALRESTDSLFRDYVAKGELRTGALRDFVLQTARGLERHSDVVSSDLPFGDPAKPLPLEAGVALSALSLLDREKLARIRICNHCAWLFLDRSRNASRRWCDMAVCGNRQKARRHYQSKVKKERANG
jgi:predicted RNA-binding Zn ribbon-like protein